LLNGAKADEEVIKSTNMPYSSGTLSKNEGVFYLLSKVRCHMFKCPVPKCDHIIADLLTNNHCETAHGLSKVNVLKKYGEPKKIGVDSEGRKKNLAMMTQITLKQFRS
jgi:hypothetical protein